jgi:organic radical activating enzyme
MINPFCKALSHRVLFTNVGVHDHEIIKYKPCCYFTKEFQVSNLENFEEARSTVAAITDWTPYCQKCKEFESNGVKSARLEINEEMIDEGIDLEIQLDKTCNAACITCGEYSSTTWEKYNKSISNQSTRFVIKPDITPNFEKILNVFDFTKHKIRIIHILGGEPFANDTHLQILSQVPDEYKSDISVAYTTNGSYKLDYKTLKVLEKFKEVDFAFSLDGIEKVFEYHRWPLKWHQVEDNFLDLVSKRKDYNFSLSIGSTLTPLNIFYFDQLEKWSSKISNEFNLDIELDFWPAFGVMSLASINQEYRNLLFEKFHYNDKLVNYIKSQPYAEHAFNDFLNHINFHSTHRKLNWQETFCDITKYF